MSCFQIDLKENSPIHRILLRPWQVNITAREDGKSTARQDHGKTTQWQDNTTARQHNGKTPRESRCNVQDIFSM